MSLLAKVSYDVEERQELKEPSFYKVLFHNDDETPMDFVVDLLMGLFGKQKPEAKKIMLDVHHQGIGVCGIYPYEIAETKVFNVRAKAKEYGYPLKCTLERES